MPMGTRHTVTGVLQDSPRGHILRVEGGGVWAIEWSRLTARHLGQRVTVHGVRSGFDRLDPTRIDLL